MTKESLKIFASSFRPPGWKTSGACSCCISSLTGASDAFLALALAHQRKGLVLALTPGLPDSDRLISDLRLLTDEQKSGSSHATRILEFPPAMSDDKSTFGLRLKTISALRAWAIKPYPCVIVASSTAVSAPLSLKTQPLHLSLQGEKANFKTICGTLIRFGYERFAQVEKEGDIAIRGGILDFWSPGDEFPIRAEFFGESLESLRLFNPATQTSISTITSCEVLPAREFDEPGTTQTIFDLLPNSAQVLALEHNSYSIDANAVGAHLSWVFTGDPAPRGVVSYDFQTYPLPGFSELGADEAHHPELFDAARQRLEQHLSASKLRDIHIEHLDELSGGFEIGGLIVVTKADRVFAKHKLPRATRAAAAIGDRLSDFEGLEPGEYVVHIDYGVGRYLGSSEININGHRSEVFTIEYADGGKLHVPAAHAHLLSRYVGIKGENVHLHRLDGKRWDKDKKDAQKAVTDLAAALLETQARREMVPGFSYQVDCEGREAFEAAFPYEETPDQVTAIDAIYKDLSSTKPMDRLICGDAGYGKTEVAMRAAFVAAMNGKQVVVLAPTTVLAEQHFETFTSRFDGTPIRIESCSRFQTTGTHAGTFKRLATGACDIVIGTHAILSPKVTFHDLGLIIIDEEQRFGVRHKEWLKRLRATADVLTLSATPIPRTLYLSMTGARDLSLLRTPPRERVAVMTRIVRDSDEVIRTAIEAEIKRGGQIYFLHNRVTGLGRIEKRIRMLCPHARIALAHGQMDTHTLARTMRDFERGKYDILLSTTIIENGVDIPRANTIFIDRADLFGMADLYQLRGRVGRSSRQGYAYFLLPPSGLIDEEARERLASLKRHAGLGSGFNLAVRDLELRGAGNLLGTQQSGHIAAIGFGLYCQLLQRTIAMLRGEKVQAIIDVKLNLDFINPRIPYDYIEDDIQRLSLMKRFAEAQNEKVLRALEKEMRDRFGPLPDEAREFVRLAELRVKCAQAKIERVDVQKTRAVLYRIGSRQIFRVVDLHGKTADAKLNELIRTMRSQEP